MTKYEGYPNFDPSERYFNKNYWERPSTKLFMTCDIKLLKLILALIITWHGKKVFRNQAVWQLKEVEVSELYYIK